MQDREGNREGGEEENVGWEKRREKWSKAAENDWWDGNRGTEERGGGGRKQGERSEQHNVHFPLSGPTK
jgi:hypothetical protein